MTSTDSHARVIVPDALAGERLDRALVELLPGFSRSRLAALVREGRVRTGELALTKPGIPVESGQVLSVSLPEEPAGATAAEARARLSILFADEHVIVVDKPAGLLVHRGEGAVEPSVAEYATALFGALPPREGADRPGIVHRLDRDTSGVLVLARTEAALAELLRQFQEREVEKSYLALVHGEPRFQSDWIDAPLGRSKRHHDRIAVMPAGEGRPARTYYEVRAGAPGCSFVECRPQTGRTHQIRVHMASIGHPVVGDLMYVPRGRKLAPWPAGVPVPARHMLHAARLAFRHPATGAALAFESPLPADFAAVLVGLGISVGA